MTTVTTPALALASLLAVEASAAAESCLPPQAGPGVADPFKAPEPKATELNEAGKVLYRQEKWEEARAQYRAAEAADPTFLAPRLNVACSFVRQERFGEAAAEVRALIERAYLPWSREVLEAADLGALKVQPQMAEIKQALSRAALAWGAGLDESVIFVGRQRAPLHIPPEGAGQFILNPHQEVFAFLPATGRFRQLTADDGHVVAVAVSLDRRRIAIVTAEKVLRGTKPGDLMLDGVALSELTLATMTRDPPIPIAGGVRRLEIAGTPHGFRYRIEGARLSGSYVVGAGHTLVSLALTEARAAHSVLAVLTPDGTLPAPPVSITGGCPVIARDVSTPGGGRAIGLTARGHSPRTIGARFGAGLAGLPLP